MYTLMQDVNNSKTGRWVYVELSASFFCKLKNYSKKIKSIHFLKSKKKPLPRSTQFTFIYTTSWRNSLSQNLKIPKDQSCLRKTMLHNGNYICNTVCLLWIEVLNFFLVLFHKESEIFGEKIQWWRLREYFPFGWVHLFPGANDVFFPLISTEFDVSLLHWIITSFGDYSQTLLMLLPKAQLFII